MKKKTNEIIAYNITYAAPVQNGNTAVVKNLLNLLFPYESQ